MVEISVAPSRGCRQVLLTVFETIQTGVLIDGYTYDATGNRLSAQVNGVLQAYTYPSDSHRLSAVAGTARTYDAAGNTTAIGGTARQYVYDATGRMSQARRAGSVTMNYRYNGKGEQVRRFLGSTNTYTLHDEAGHWLGDYDGNGAPLQQAIWLDDLPVGLLVGGELRYIEPDHLGSPRVVIDPARDVAIWTWSLKGEAFGNTAPDQDTDGDGSAFVLDMRLPGQRYDAATGLNQNGNRDYDPASGRYPKSDPLGLRGGISTYSYAYSNPLMWIDPDGLQVVPAIPMGPGMTGAAGAAGAYSLNNPNDPNNLGDFGPKISGEDVATVLQLNEMISPHNMGNPKSTFWTLTKAIVQEVCRDDDDKDKCENLLKVDMDTCNAITRSRGGRAGARCHASATQRYAACLRDQPIPPLDTWNN